MKQLPPDCVEVHLWNCISSCLFEINLNIYSSCSWRRICCLLISNVIKETLPWNGRPINAVQFAVIVGATALYTFFLLCCTQTNTWTTQISMVIIWVHFRFEFYWMELYDNTVQNACGYVTLHKLSCYMHKCINFHTISFFSLLMWIWKDNG